MLLRVNNTGDIVWARRFALPEGLYETIETPIYDQIKNRIISGGIHQRTTGDQDGLLIRDIKQADGQQISGNAPRSRTFSINNTDFRRAYLYKKENPANGYYMTLIGATSDDVALDAMDAVIVSLDTALNIQWQRRFGGIKYDYIKRAMAWCSNNDIIGMGGTRSSPGASGYDLFFCRMFSNGQFDDQSAATCIINSAYIPTNINYTNTAITSLVATNLGNNWQKTITNMGAPINVLPYLALRMEQCTTGVSSSLQAPEFNFVENTGEITVNESKITNETEIKLSLNSKSLLNFSFKVVDKFEFVYFHTDKPDIVINGIKLQKTKDLPPGEYIWIYEAMLPNGMIDMKSWEFSVNK